MSFMMKRCFPTELAEIKNVEIIITEFNILVQPYWKNVYFQTGSGWSLKPTDYPLAVRLVAAIKDGVIYTNARVQKNSIGQTYVAHGYSISNRHVDRDLKRLGF